MSETNLSTVNLRGLSRGYVSIADALSKSYADSIVEWLRSYAARRINSKTIDDRRCIPPYVALDIGNEGLLGIIIEESYSGKALCVRDVCRVIEQAAAIDLSLATWLVTSIFAGTRAISMWSTREVKDEWLPALATGRSYGAYAQTEPQAGSDFMAVEATARLEPAGTWILNGKKHWIGNGSWSGVMAVVCQVLDSDGVSTGLGSFVVPTDSQGVHLGEEHLSMGLRGMVQSRIMLDNVRLDEKYILGNGSGLGVSLDTMSFTRLALAAASLGAMKRCFQLSYRYSSRRRLAQGSLVTRAMTRALLGELTCRIEVTEALVGNICASLDDGAQVPVELLAAAKILATEWLGDATDRFLQVLGGRGFDEANIAAQLYRDARVYRIFEGATEALLDFLGSRTLGQWHRVESLLSLVGAPDLATILENAAEEFGERSKSSESGDTRDWGQALAGKALVLAVGLAAARNSDSASRKSLDYMEGKFQEAISCLCLAGAIESAILTEGDLESAASRYERCIGDVEQTLPGGSLRLDPYLRGR